MEQYEKRLSRILPIPKAALNPNWSSETFRTEAEIWCKPFACIVQGCSEPRVRNDEEKFRCLEAPRYFNMCVEEVLKHMKEVISQ